MATKKAFQIQVFLVVLTILLARTAFALDPKDFIPAPEGTKALLFYYNNTSGNEAYVDGDKVSNDMNLQADVGIFRAVYYGMVGSYPWDVNLLLPFGRLSLDGAAMGGAETATTGTGDPILVGVFWPIANAASRTWLGVSEYITIPGGEYDNDRTLSMGSNTWAFKTEVGLAKGIGTSNFHWDLSGNVEFYTKNDDYTAASLNLKKDPLLTTETHLTYDFTKTVAISADYNYANGGESSENGTTVNGKMNDHTAGMTLAFWLTSSSQLLLSYKDKLYTENGIDADTFCVRLAYCL